ncbi:MAG: hypothetical protein CMP22_01635 [Rickettsiales bacterium]|nr:hypothetical protein [Rickettsiales bacterium]|tara:strand:- start:2439 stop:2687 length:249 start_codon:yes stop_codon:yes gene_type:complete
MNKTLDQIIARQSNKVAFLGKGDVIVLKCEPAVGLFAGSFEITALNNNMGIEHIKKTNPAEVGYVTDRGISSRAKQLHAKTI